jgi:cell wall-associated NlpC family hydrolase
MRRGLWLLFLALLAAALGAVSARAADPGTTTTGTTTTATTTTATTTTGTTTTPPTYAALPLFSLPSGCLGAGAAAVLPPSHAPIALGTPGINLGPSAYPSSGSVLTFSSSTESGRGCTTKVTLSSVSLFGGAVTASSVEGSDGKGSVAGLAIDGSAVAAAAGETLHVESWGQLTLGATVGRVTAPLVLRLLQAHDSLPAGTAVVVAFAATARHVAKPKPNQQAGREGQHGVSGSGKHSGVTHGSLKHRRKQPSKPPPDFPVLSYSVVVHGRLAAAAQHNPVVSTAMQYLGVRYTWGGASPKTGFDCSGLVEYVFAQLGVSLPHFAASQWYSPDSVYVAPTRLKPGDLVFFTGSDGTRKEPGHVGIYVGDGYLIDAPHTGSFVRIDSLNEPAFANQFVGARRIVGPLHHARHLAQVTDPQAFGAGFQPQISLEPLGDTLGTAAADPPAIRTASGGSWTWAVAGGLVLLFTAGALVVRRHHRMLGDDGDAAGP